MTERRFFVAGVGVAAAACALVLCWRAMTPRAISVESYYRIRVGMTQQQVEGILGGPPRNDSDRTCFTHCSPMENHKVWVGHDVLIFIWFNDDGTVRGKDLQLRPESDTKNRSYLGNGAVLAVTLLIAPVIIARLIVMKRRA